MKRTTILQEIKDLVDSEFGFDINVKNRKQSVVFARAVYYRLCREYTKASLYEIGELLSKNHATVLHGLKLFKTFQIQPKHFRRELEIYKAISSELSDSPKQESTLLERIQKEKQEVLKIHAEIQDKYMNLKDKHNRMLKYFSKYERNAYENHKV